MKVVNRCKCVLKHFIKFMQITMYVKAFVTSVLFFAIVFVAIFFKLFTENNEMYLKKDDAFLIEKNVKKKCVALDESINIVNKKLLYR